MPLHILSLLALLITHAYADTAGPTSQLSIAEDNGDSWNRSAVLGIPAVVGAGEETLWHLNVSNTVEAQYEHRRMQIYLRSWSRPETEDDPTSDWPDLYCKSSHFLHCRHGSRSRTSATHANYQATSLLVCGQTSPPSPSPSPDPPSAPPRASLRRSPFTTRLPSNSARGATTPPSSTSPAALPLCPTGRRPTAGVPLDTGRRDSLAMMSRVRDHALRSIWM